MSKHLVTLIESESGWGQRVDEIKRFDTEQEATDFVKEFNSKNTADTAPDWYMVAVYSGMEKLNG